MADKKPVRAVFNDSNVATGLAEFQSGDTVGLTHGGLGASLSIGTAGQVLKVNSGASALEFGSVEAIVNIDGATDLESATLAVGDKLLLSDGGTEGRVLLSQLDTLFSGTSKTLTNKTISADSNTLSGIAASSFVLSNASGNIDGSASQKAIPSGTVVGSSDSQTLTNKTISGASNTLSNIGNSSLSNSTITVTDGSSSTATALGGTITFSGTSNEVEVAESSGTITIGLPTNPTVGGNLTVTGNLTVNGTTTTVSTTNTTVSDKLLELATGTSGTPSGDVGIVGERGSSANIFIGFDESADEFTVGTGSFTGATTGDLSITKGNLSLAALRVYNSSNYVQLASPSLAGNITLTLPSTDGSANQLLATDGSGNLSFISATAASGAGLSDVSDDTTPTLGGDLDANAKIIKNVKLLDHDYLGASYGPSSAPVTITVTVATKTAAHPYSGDGSSLAYFLNGIESPAIQLHGADNVTSDSGYYYRFDQAEATNDGHPLRFYLDADKTTAYTTGVTTNGTPGNAGAYTQIDVDEDTPSILYYQCSSHAYMGNYATVPASNKINHTEALISMPTSTGTLVGTGDTGTVTNAMLAGSIANDKLAGSIANAKLANSTVSFGGIQLALGASDATPAFDLSDATNYPTSSLSGTITNAQLAGSIAASKLAGSIGDSLLSTITTAGKVELGALEIDGATEMDAALADADLLIVDDGAGGTEKSMLASRIPTYVFSKVSGDATVASNGALTIAAGSVENSMLADDAVGADELAANAVVNASVSSSAAIAFSKMENLTASRALVSDGSGDVSASAVTSTEIGHLDGVSSNVQTQLDTKATNAFAIAQAVALG